MIVWMLTKFYQCPEFDWLWPVCSAYGDSPFCPQRPSTPDGWALVRMHTTPQHIEASKLDPRVIVCGKDYNKPPKEVLDTYADKLDSNETYMFMGQVLAKLAETEPNYHAE